ncbi:GDP dissociation inhibitor [Cynara cardunculus var. scolymus]|uniref:GDP dissociation inhibitor n=1 Tax=Cynara cardunculus var. scolymus TaxID=59895 RepID=A0A103Q023_CYNCS|nr:GDP dissociation inhibitor [Cynara cardunculus var. scolymus]
MSSNLMTYLYVEFKNIDASYVGDTNGNLMKVPDSKSGVFKDKTLKYSEKNQLNSFFKLVQGHLEAVKSVGVGVGDGKIISDEDLENPFVAIILYAIVMVDYDQDGGESCKDILRTTDGIDRLALYHSSVGRSIFFSLPVLVSFGYNDLPTALLVLFQKLYPDDEFFPETGNTDSPDKLEDDDSESESITMGPAAVAGNVVYGLTVDGGCMADVRHEMRTA